jgi:hypothetical protein
MVVTSLTHPLSSFWPLSGWCWCGLLSPERSARPGLKALSSLTLWTPHHPLPENPVMVKRVGRLVVTWREKPLPKS